MDLIVDRSGSRPSPRRQEEPPLADLRKTRLRSIDPRRAAQVADAEVQDDGDLGRINSASFGSAI